MANLSTALRPYIHLVLAESQPRVPRQPPTPRPEVGLLWGDTSQFYFDRDPGGLGADGEAGVSYHGAGHEVVIHRGEEVYRQFDVVRFVKNDMRIDVERLNEVIFYMGETEVVQERRVSQLTVQPERIITRHYIRMSFPFNAEGQVVGSGERGERPEAPPPEHTIADELREASEMWARFVSFPL